MRLQHGKSWLACAVFDKSSSDHQVKVQYFVDSKSGGYENVRILTFLLSSGITRKNPFLRLVHDVRCALISYSSFVIPSFYFNVRIFFLGSFHQ